MQTASPSRTTKRLPQRLYILPKVLGVGILLATLFTAWLPKRGFSQSFTDQLRSILTPVPAQSGAAPNMAQLKIGIVSGHNGYDSGAVCRDGAERVTLTEAEVNLKIAVLVQKQLVDAGYIVDLLDEFDPRLDGYSAVALVSIHNDSCEYINDQATGFKVSPAMNTRDLNRALRLTECLSDRYQRTTGLPFHAGSITVDMRDYHAFSEIDSNTVAAIIETGFLNLDREFLTNKTDLVATGIVRGIECFVRNENIELSPTSPAP